MARIILFSISITLCFSLFAQDSEGNGQVNNIEKCGQFEALNKMQIEDPARFQLYQQSRAELEQETDILTSRAGTTYTIPVVFHVLHNNGPENISDQQIEDALFILNRDFRKNNSDVNLVHSSFLPITADVNIEFEFATIAPNGLCFNGITRTVSPATSNGENGFAQVNAIVNGNDVYQGIWPHHKYLNIYVCDDLGTAAGYTYLPNGTASVDIDDMRYNSIFMRHDYLGSIGTSSEFGSRVLTHEVGHWLNLSHIWGGSGVGEACGDDGVPDTPETKGFNYCPSNPNNAKICDPNRVENYENYMDYSFCAKMFTLGQAARMRDAIISTVGGRNNIWTAANLAEVGVTGSPEPLCAAQIEADETLICQNSSVTYSLIGVSEPITSYLWNFPGGTPATSTQANPVVTYNNPGTYDVTLYITTALINKTITNTSYITIDNSSSPTALPFTEGFVSTVFPPQGWIINNEGHPTTWQRSTKGTAPTFGNSAVLDFDLGANTTGDIDDLITPMLSLNGQSSATLTFDVAYRRYSNYFSDKLEVLVSPACGMPYQVVYSKAGSVLETEPEGFGYDDPAVWRNESIDLSAFVGNPEVKVKFRGISGWGNKIYIDNININGSATFAASAYTVCQGETVTYTSTDPSASSWIWNFGIGASPSTATGPGPHEVTYFNPGDKTVSLSLDNGLTSTSQTVNIKPLPALNFTELPTLCIYNSSITLNQGSPSGGTYSGVGITGNQFNPSTAGIGSHTITYTYTSSTTNCVDSISQEIIVDGCLGIENEEDQSFSIFPNPTTGAITVSSSYIINQITVLDHLGRIVVTLKPENSKQTDLDLSGVSSGVYTILTELNSATMVRKVVVN